MEPALTSGLEDREILPTALTMPPSAVHEYVCLYI